MRRLILDSILFTYFCIIVATLVINPQGEEAQIAFIMAWPWGFVLFALGVALSTVCRRFGLVTLGDFIFESSKFQKIWYKSLWAWQLFIFFGLTLGISLQVTHFSVFEMTDHDGFAGAVRLFSGLVHPSFSILPRAILNVIETIFIAFLATTLAVPIAFCLCFFCAKNIMTGKLAFSFYLLLRAFLNIIRSVEALIWAIIFTVWVGIGPFAGMLALFVHSVSSLAKQYSEIVESVSEGPIDGIRSTGATTLQSIWYGIVPQVVLPFISFTIYRWDINVRMATIIGFVGGGGIGSMLVMYQGQARWPEVGCIIMVIAIVVWFMDTLSAYVREALK